MQMSGHARRYNYSKIQAAMAEKAAAGTSPKPEPTDMEKQPLVTNGVSTRSSIPK